MASSFESGNATVDSVKFENLNAGLGVLACHEGPLNRCELSTYDERPFGFLHCVIHVSIIE